MSLGKLISSLLGDSKKFLLLARDASKKKQDTLTLSYSRAVFFSAWSAMEGWINYIAYSFAQTDHSLSEYEVSFLKEKKIEIDENGIIRITKQDEYHPTLTKLVFILRRFGNNFDLRNTMPDLWHDLKEIEKIRHSIVHPKTREQEVCISLKDAEKCFDAVVKMVNLLKEKIYEK